MSDESRPEATDGTPKRKGRPQKKHTIGRVILASMVVLSLVTALGIIYFYRHLNGNIESESLESLKDRPEKVYDGNGKPLNILVMGSDTREGEGNAIDGEGGGGSDTTILVHLSADRSRAYAVSIPRDTIVDRPECGDSPAADDVRWNSAYLTGGPVCTLQLVEATTGIYVDHFVVVDFNGFGEMVDAVGGVPVCVPGELKDPEHQIYVPAGNPALLTGDQALDYVRARYVGELIQQNDISRIKRQQTFIAALVREVKSTGTLARFDKVVNFLDAATKSLTTDEQLASVTRIGKIAMQLQNIGLDNVKFVTVPTEYYPMDSEFRGAVRWTDEAKDIWRLLNHDKELPPRLLDGSISAEPPASASDAETGTSATETPETPSGSATSEAPESETPDPSESESPDPTESETPDPTASESPEPPTEAGPATKPKEQVPGVCA